jgi:predicted DNA-binding transcriptional regulator AlpA
VSRPPQHPGSSQHPAADPPQGIDDRLIDIAEIRRIFRLGRTAAYELTHRPEFPDPVAVSPRCYRWWASEVIAFTATLRQGSTRRCKRQTRKSCPADAPAAPRRIIGQVRAARSSKGAS